MRSAVAVAIILAAAALAAATAHAQARQPQPPRTNGNWWERGATPLPADVALAQQADSPSDPSSTSPLASEGMPGAPAFRWRLIFSHPRIGGRLTSVAVDPNDPERIFVGSEEGTVFRSFDGGITWDERPVYPLVVTDRALGLDTPGLPALGSTTPPQLQMLVFPPFARAAGYPAVPFAGYAPNMGGTDHRGRPFGAPLGESGGDIRLGTTENGVMPSFVSPFILGPGVGLPSLLASVTRSQRFRTDRVRTFAFCPGNDFPLLAITRSQLYGSADDGTTWVRLFRVPGRVELIWVTCNPNEPEHVAVATSFGMFRSRDGGNSFNQETSGWPGAAVTAVTFYQNKMLTANGSVLFRGDPDSAQGMEMVYPDFNNNETAPWTTIGYVEPTPSGQLWLATADGLRASLDGGTTWTVPGRTLFSRQPILMVVAGANDQGGERIAAMMGRGPGGVEGVIYASDDRGENWFPFFHGMTRRSMQHLAALPPREGQPPRWWVVAGHEVWATAEPTPPPGLEIDPAAARWARERLARNPTVHDVIDEALDHTGLRVDRIREFTDGLKGRGWLPVLVASFFYNNPQTAYLGSRELFEPFVLDGRVAEPHFEFFIQATWYFMDFVLVNEEFNGFQNEIHELRRQISFAAEDAWRERVTHLSRMARGDVSAYQAAVLQARVEAIDAVLETWLGRPVEDVGRHRGSRRMAR